MQLVGLPLQGALLHQHAIMEVLSTSWHMPIAHQLVTCPQLLLDTGMVICWGRWPRDLTSVPAVWMSLARETTSSGSRWLPRGSIVHLRSALCTLHVAQFWLLLVGCSIGGTKPQHVDIRIMYLVPQHVDIRIMYHRMQNCALMQIRAFHWGSNEAATQTRDVFLLQLLEALLGNGKPWLTGVGVVQF
jgi:hypothetical protein